VAVPLGVALVGTRFALQGLQTKPGSGKWVLAVAIGIAAFHAGRNAVRTMVPAVPRADLARDYQDRTRQIYDYLAWRAACEWVAASGEIPTDARFLTPRMSQTFKWYARRSEVVTWKDVPQDARSIVQWWDTLHAVHAARTSQGGYRWHNSLAEVGTERIERLGRRYEADYVLTVRWPRLGLPVVYENHFYVIYRLSDPGRP
jgi:hypothetical protein